MIVNRLPFLFQKSPTPNQAWIETAVITLTIPGIGFLIDGSDPFFLNSQFPWLILSPLLLSLQYGLAYGMTSAGFFIAILSLGSYFQWAFIPIFPTISIVGMLLTTLITGEYYDLWQRRQKKLEQDHQYLKTRMDEFTRIYQVLKASHSQIEQELSSQTKNLRTSLLLLEKQIYSIQQHPGNIFDDIGKPILEVFSAHSNIYAASLFSVNSNKVLTTKAIAYIGSPANIQISNPLVQQALISHKVVSVQNHAEETGAALVAIPLVDVFDVVWGLVVVTEMPFFALHSSTLDLLAVMGGRIGDLLNRRSELHPSKSGWKDFELALRRILIEIKRLHYSTVIVVTKFTSQTLGHHYIPKLLSESRGLDKTWVFENQYAHQVAIQLLPFTDNKGISSFFDRLGLSGLNSDDEDSTDTSVSIQQWTLDASIDANKILSELNQFCHFNSK